MREPDWIEHDGSAVCPVPVGHLVEKCWPSATSFDGTWATVSRYRDWTAFEEQQAAENLVPVDPLYAALEAAAASIGFRVSTQFVEACRARGVTLKEPAA